MIHVLNNGFDYNAQGEVSHAWYEIEENGEHFFRAVALRELKVLSWNQDEKEETLLGRQTAGITGIHRSEANFLYAACGIYDPWMGIIQMYGAAENGKDKYSAIMKLQSQIAAVESSLCAFPQTKLAKPNIEVLRWYSAFITQANNVLALLGYPDPRTKSKLGTPQNGNLPDESSNDLSVEQLEIFFRGMSALGESFIYQVAADRVDEKSLLITQTMINQITSDYASQQRGVKSATVSVGIPIMVNASQGVSDGRSRGESQSQGEVNSASRGWGRSETNSAGHTESRSLSLGSAETFGESRGVSVGASHTDSHSTSKSIGHTDSWGVSQSQGVSAGQSQGGSWSEGGSVAVSAGEGSSWGESASAGASQGVSGNIGVNAGVNASIGGNMGNNQGYSASEGGNQSAGINVSQNFSQGGMSSSNMGVNQSQSQSIGGADSVTVSEQHGVADGVNVSVSRGQSHSITSSVNRTQGSADSIGKARGVSENWGEGHAVSESLSQSQGQNVGRALGTGISGGIAPSISLGRSWQTEDRVAMRLTEDLSYLSSMMLEAVADGGFMTDVIVITETEIGLKAAETLLPQSLHGKNVVRPIVTVTPESDAEKEEMIRYASVFLPHSETTEDEIPPNDPFYGKLWTKLATTLAARHVASLTSPSLVRGGTLRIIERVPKELAVYPENKGEVVLGHYISPETTDVTSAPVRLDKSRLMHTMFAANTGFGKSVAAMRMVREMAVHWNMRCVVLDFGLGWRQLWNDNDLRDKTVIRQLHPHGAAPLRWNPLQIGRYIDPETQIRGFVDNFGSIAQLGQKQQQHRFYDAVRELYIGHGVLLTEDMVINSPWGNVHKDEVAICGVREGTPIQELKDANVRQLLSIERSKKIGLVDLYNHINKIMNDLDKKDQIGRTVLDGILQRLRALTQGEAGKQFGKEEPGNPAIPIEDLGRDVSGLTILEGGKFLGTFEKAWLLGWAGWMIYTDMVRRRELHLNMGEADLVMVLEEANILFTGLETGDPEQNTGPTVSEQWSNMFRDSRKYGCYFMLITQSPALIPPGIRNSCNNIILGYLTDPKDKDVALSALARSEKGFHDEPWRRFLSTLSIGMMVARFPYSQERADQMPFIYRPSQLLLDEPTDKEIKDYASETQIPQGVLAP